MRPPSTSRESSRQTRMTRARPPHTTHLFGTLSTASSWRFLWVPGTGTVGLRVQEWVVVVAVVWSVPLFLRGASIASSHVLAVRGQAPFCLAREEGRKGGDVGRPSVEQAGRQHSVSQSAKLLPPPRRPQQPDRQQDSCCAPSRSQLGGEWRGTARAATAARMTAWMDSAVRTRAQVCC